MESCFKILMNSDDEKRYIQNKPKGLKVAKEDQRLIGSLVNGLDGQ